ncbi:hypothetical protein GNI_043730 [Gregarina niphandrodes]|uniref:Uncharacterized protein n=1 Tax=Gregarina niphandrodes TaxID=110365 RepID=A0A023B9Y2_GRENI|nr:hypothetical protein GNI_043730 [Gregarina niphandrodes]EZG76991.1 hypothetical protein GNI_043730 [Gregarina niphandrodes]|eukprot:XP_011129550.1 hypothetical protein GNI_043730 [Gregarina niphandrodes]
MLDRSKYEELRGWWAGQYGLTVRGLFGLAGDSSELETEGWTLAVEGRRSRYTPRPLYAPSLGRLTSFARSCCLFRSEYDAFASLYGSLESKSWESLKSIKLHDFGRCNLAYVELSTIITMFFDWPTYLRRTACPQAAEQLLRNLTRMPTATPAEFIEPRTRQSLQAKQDKRGNELTPENAPETAASEAAASEAATSEAAASETAGRNLVAAVRYSGRWWVSWESDLINSGQLKCYSDQVLKYPAQSL